MPNPVNNVGEDPAVFLESAFVLEGTLQQHSRTFYHTLERHLSPWKGDIQNRFRKGQEQGDKGEVKKGTQGRGVTR